MEFEVPKIVDIDLLERLQRLHGMIFNKGKTYRCDPEVYHRRDMENFVSNLLHDVKESGDYDPYEPNRGRMSAYMESLLTAVTAPTELRAWDKENLQELHRELELMLKI